MKRLVLRAIREIGLDTPNVDCIVAHKLMDPVLLYEYVHAIAEELRHQRDATEDSRQGWLALPEYQHVPTAIAAASQQELRARIAKLERKIASYDYARRSPQKLKTDKAELRELKRIDARTATLFAGAPTLDVNGAMVELIQRLQTPAAARNRRQAKHAISTRWTRTKNQ